MHSCATEMYIVYDFDCSACKLDSQDCTFGSPTKVDHGCGFIMCWAIDVRLLSSYFDFTHTWNFSTGVKGIIILNVESLWCSLYVQLFSQCSDIFREFLSLILLTRPFYQRYNYKVKVNFF